MFFRKKPKKINNLKNKAKKTKQETVDFFDSHFMRFIKSQKILIPIMILLFLLFRPVFCNIESEKNKTNSDIGGTEAALANYKYDVLQAAKKYELQPSYLMALIMLECSGKKNIKPRFEKHVYRKLKALRDGKIKKFENLTPETIHDANDDALRNLAKSWGPFQLMGYKCVILELNIKDIRGVNSIDYGADWINMTYGDYLRKKRFKDAFHIHNTGQPYPKNGRPRTYDPNYVNKGLKYMNYFKDLDNQID